ncbi:hypothetical protein GCM10010286_02970 [Streptomyces toxytricini]|nr:MULTISPECIES: ATP-binding cassette domain-containing protein [Streptomyces]GGS81799.1 hypothetical protein GCM10010286_02970 [Streptomyces toxytricini]
MPGGEGPAIPAGGQPLPERLREVRFESGTFPSPAGAAALPEPTLRDVSLSFPAGKITSLVGETGSGKSTLVKLLAGLYAPDEGGGMIWRDGVDSRTAGCDQLFDRVALMSRQVPAGGDPDRGRTHQCPVTRSRNRASSTGSGPSRRRPAG